MLRRSLALGTACGLIALSACGLDVVGEALPPGGDAGLTGVDANTKPGDDDTDGAAPAIDGSSDPGGGDAGALDAGALDGGCTDGTACKATLKEGWSPIALPNTPGGACPKAYTALTLHHGSVGGSGACACTAKPSATEPPACDEDKNYFGMVNVINLGKCGFKTTQPIVVTGTACTALPDAASGWTSARFAPIKPSGACEATCAPDPQKVTTTPVQLCEPPPTCVEDTCISATNGANDGPFRACLAHDGEVACPDANDAGQSAMVRVVVGDNASVECSGAACTTTVTCGPATLHLFNDGACANPEYATLKADDTCQDLAAGAKAMKYESAITGVTSAMTTEATPSVRYTGTTKTVCCAGSAPIVK